MNDLFMDRDLRHFSLATWMPSTPRSLKDEAALLGKAVLWLVDHRLPDGTWGGPDAQERFEATFQVAQTLLMAGISPESAVLRPALTYLQDQDVHRLPITFWRAGTFVNIPGFEGRVMEDLEFGWLQPRAGLFQYPPSLFLLKCLLFIRDPLLLPSFTCEQIVQRVINDWSPEECWADLPSLTSMGMALVYDLDFPDRESILERCRSFLLQRAAMKDPELRCGFAKTLAEDCFVIFNICERPLVFAAEEALGAVITHRVKTIWEEQTEGGYWRSDQPFEGTTAGGGVIEPTAIAVRALASYHSITEKNFVGAIADSLLEQCAIEVWTRRRLYPVTDELAQLSTAADAQAE